MTQLDIDLEIRGTISRAETKVRSRGTTPTPETEEVEQGVLPGTDPEGRFRTSEKLGPKLRLQTEYYLHQLDERGVEWLLDEEVAQWLNDLKVVRAHYREVEEEWFSRGDGGTEDARYAHVIERIVRGRAKPAYEGQPVPELEELFDPHCLVMEEFSEKASSADSGESDKEAVGDLGAARRAAKPTRKRVKVAVARARCIDERPELRAQLEARLA